MARPWLLAAFIGVIAASHVGMAGLSSADEESIDTIAVNIDFALGSDFPIETRRLIFSLLIRYWNKLDAKIPRPTPAEDAWFMAERSSGDRARQDAAMDTRIGQLEFLIGYVSFCEGKLQSQYNDNFIGKQNPFHPGHDLEVEAENWLEISQACLLHLTNVKWALDNAGIPDATITPTHAAYWNSGMQHLIHYLISQDLTANFVNTK